MKNGKIIFNEEVKKIQQMISPDKSIDIIIEDLYKSIMSNLHVNNIVYYIILIIHKLPSNHYKKKEVIIILYN